MKFKRHFEELYPMSLTLVFSFLYFFYRMDINVILESKDNRDFILGLLNTYITIGAIFSGFLTAAGSIFSSHTSNYFIDQLRKTGHLERIVSFSSSATYSNIFSVCVSFIIVPIVHLHQPLVSSIFWIWLGLVVFSFTSFLRITIIYNRIALCSKA